MVKAPLLTQVGRCAGSRGGASTPSRGTHEQSAKCYDELATLPRVSSSQSARIIAQPHFYIVLQFVSFPEDFSELKLSQSLD